MRSKFVDAAFICNNVDPNRITHAHRSARHADIGIESPSAAWRRPHWMKPAFVMAGEGQPCTSSLIRAARSAHGNPARGCAYDRDCFVAALLATATVSAVHVVLCDCKWHRSSDPRQGSGMLAMTELASLVPFTWRPYACVYRPAFSRPAARCTQRAASALRYRNTGADHA